VSIAILLAALPPPRPPLPLPGTYTNEEEVYFDDEAKRTPAPWTGLKSADGSYNFVDKFGSPVSDVIIRKMDVSEDSRVWITFPNGRVTELRRARPVTCWGAIPKTAKKPDGTDDWYFMRELKLHDQGGRVQFGGGDTGAPPVVIRMRNVIWPSGPSQPSLVLYVHKPETPDRAESYSWADPGAKRIGINLRWMQASCTIDTMEKAK
jgi:hypothetical protein